MPASEAARGRSWAGWEAAPPEVDSDGWEPNICWSHWHCSGVKGVCGPALDLGGGGEEPWFPTSLSVSAMIAEPREGGR